MGMAVAQLRLIYLNQQRHDLEYNVQLITEAKMNLAKTCTDLLNVGSDLGPDEPIVKQLQARKDRLNIMEKQLDERMHQYNARLQMINTEISSCEKMLTDNIQRSFKY